MRRGCLKGLSRKASVLVMMRTTQICTVSKGKTKLMGLLPCHNPMDDVFINLIHVMLLWIVAFAVMKVLITALSYICKSQRSINKSQCPLLSTTRSPLRKFQCSLRSANCSPLRKFQCCKSQPSQKVSVPSSICKS